MELASTRGGVLDIARAALRPRTLMSGLLALTALVALANLAVLAAQCAALVHNMYLNADNASALVLPALAGHAAPGATVNLGNHPWYEPWLFMRATVGLPGYRQLWEAAPLLGGVLSSAAVAACAWWALGRIAGLVSATVLFAGSEAIRWTLYVPESHGLVVLHLAALCAGLLFVQRRAFACRLTPRALVLVGVPLALFTGAGFTDQLAYVSGLAPLLLAPWLCWLRGRSRAWLAVAAFALVEAVASGLLAILLTHIMQQQNVIHAAFPINFVGSEAIVSGLQNLLATLAILGGGGFFGAPASGTNLLTLLAGLLVLVGVFTVLRLVWRWTMRTDGMPARSTTRAGVGPSAPLADSDATPTRELFIAFWGAVLVLVLVVFALTSVSANTADGRYLIGAWAALAALLGALCINSLMRVTVLVCAAAFGLLNVHTELATGVAPGAGALTQATAGAIEHYVDSHGVSVGYTGYWDAAPVTWATHLRVKLYPIQECGTPQGWCPSGGNQINSWYAPNAQARTFILTDTRGIQGELTSPPPAFGHPVISQAIEGGFTVYIYDHDVAADLGP